MKFYKFKRKLIEFQCDYCGNTETKPLSEYNRNQKLNRKSFCSRTCAIKFSNKENPRTVKDKNFIRQFSHNAVDDFTPFRYTYRNVKKRFKDVEIDLSDLKEIWESQKGICPYTKFQLELPRYNNKLHPSIRASLDRIDSKKGYVKGNIQFVSTLANYMKSDISHDDMIHFRDTIVKNFCSCYQEDQTISSPVLGVGR